MNLISQLISPKQQNPSNATGISNENAPVIKPVYDLRENADDWTLTAFFPGVNKADIELTVDDTQIRIYGRRIWKTPEGWSSLYRESSDAAFELLIEHSKAVDAEGIRADLKDGVLQATFPKAASIKPRKIAIS